MDIAKAGVCLALMVGYVMQWIVIGTREGFSEREAEELFQMGLIWWLAAEIFLLRIRKR